MTNPDSITIMSRAFNTPLLLDPAKAAVIAPVLARRVPDWTEGAEIRLAGAYAEPGAEHRQSRPQAASLLGDEVHRVVSKRGGGYSNIQGVAVIPVVGTLVRRGSYVGAQSGVTSYEGLSAQIRAAAADDEVRAIALEIDSFGGEADGIFEIAKTIRAAREVKPVHAFLAEHALSAGYAIASQADTVTIPPFGQAGSIGVVSMHMDISEKLAQEGVTVTLIHSGAKKVEGNPFEKLPEETRAEIQGQNDAMWVEFAQMVETGRRGKISAEDALRLEAGVFRGAEAVRLGLADQVAEAREGFSALLAQVNPPLQVAASGSKGPGMQPVSINLADQSQAAQQFVERIAAVAAQQVSGTRLGNPFAGSSGCVPGATAPQSKETDMSNVTKPDANQQSAKTQDAPDNSDAIKAASDAAVKADRERMGKIKAKIAKIGLPAERAATLEAKFLAEGTSYTEALDIILDAKADAQADGGDIKNTASGIQITHDGHDRLKEGMTRALYAKVRLDGGEQNEFSSMQLREMGRAILLSQGGQVPSGGVMALASAIFAPASMGGVSGAAHSTSDFGNILADVANKSMLKGFAEVPETFETFTSTGTLTDFKPHKRVGLDAFPALKKVEEGAEFQYGTMGDHGESAVLATYGRLFAITRQTIINDDLDAFSKVPLKMGRAARRTVGDLVFAVLTSNPQMSDGTALFHADHKNLADSGAAPSEATINAAITAMMTQKDRGDNATALNIALKYIVSGPVWRSALKQALNSEYAPDDTSKVGTTKMSRAFNTVKDAAYPIFDARLADDAWFGLADPTLHDTIEVGYLDGVSTPFLDQQDGWTVDGTEFKVRIDAAVTALAWEAMYKNPGS